MILLAGLALQADLGDAPTTPTATTTTTTTTTTNTLPAAAAKAAITPAITAATTTTTTTATSASTMVPAITTSATTKETDAMEEGVGIAHTEETTTTATTTNAGAISISTTLPKISKRKNSANERMLRLSTYVAATSKVCASPHVAATSSVFPLGGSLKRGLSAVAATLSATVTPTNATAAAAAAATPTENIEAEYFRVEDYLPLGLRNAWAVNALCACHRENRGMSSSDAELHYIQQACMVHESINAHTFRMRMTKNESGTGSSYFVVYAKGIKIIQKQQQQQQQQQTQQQQQHTTFLWPNITKLSFERKKFEIRSGESKITLYATSDEKNKMLLTLCKETHQFSMKIAARLKEVIKRDEEESNCLRACYIYSRSLHLLYKNKNDQRISVISSTSSNTTSGIVSDRVHSEDELEIMINTPPAPIAAPSTESLALAHLLDRPSVSRQTSSVGQVSLKDLEEQLAALSVRQGQQQQQQQQHQHSGGESPTDLYNTSAGNSSSSNSAGSIPTTSTQRNVNSSSTATDSPSSQHNIGSQCSSTCSTVVVAASTATESAANALASFAVQRRNSTSSSLELGFSHTAQNSTLSEAESTCIEHDYLPSTRDESESVSGVYTLAHGVPPTETSGVYTMHSSELTGQSSEMAESEKSSHYGIFKPDQSTLGEHVNLDSVDGGNYGRGKCLKHEDFRLRSDSNVSTSGSFRGDGSDPTDNKHTLLSAEELTELIVGRGTYPSRKTVASTLDSDCDYVTLPLPMAGESYIQGHQDTAPTEDQVEDLINDLLPVDPPAPPQRIDSNGNVPFARLSNMRMRSPPPYNARHEKTGLCGPPVHGVLPAKMTTPTATAINKHINAPSTEVKTVLDKGVAAQPPLPTSDALVRRRDPPPYPTTAKPRPTSLVSLASSTSTSTSTRSPGNQALAAALSTRKKSEEVPARIITSRPQINILKAHTSVIGDGAKPCYAAPTNSSAVMHHLSSQLSQHSAQNSNYVCGSQSSLSLSHHVAPTAIPLIPYSLHGAHKSMSSLHHQATAPPPPPYSELKPPPPRTCVLLPVIKPQQFLPPPPPSLPRQPPPPPPTQLAAAAVYGKQLELYQQQLYSDVDYVIYPIQDPAVSQQEYLDAKQGSLLAAMAAQAPPQPHSYLAAYHHPAAWDTCKAHAIYRSTPYLPMALSAHSRYASTQNLSDTYVQLPSACSPLYSPSMASLCSSFEPPPPPPLHPASLAAAASAHSQSSLFGRSRSDDNILNSLDALPKMKRLPPPPPPPYVDRRLKKPPMPIPTEQPPPIPSKPAANLSRYHLPPRKPPTLSNSRHSHSPMTKTSSGAQWAGERPKADAGLGRGTGSASLLAQLQASMVAAQRQACVDGTATPTGATASSVAAANALDIALLREKSRHLDLPLISALCNDRSLLKQTKLLVKQQASSPTATTSGNNNGSMSSNSPLAMARKVSSISHRHPNDKLPPLPMQLAEANNYVMDPAVLKHQKSYNNSNSNNNMQK